jgi:hypothetical protein
MFFKPACCIRSLKQRLNNKTNLSVYWGYRYSIVHLKIQMRAPVVASDVKTDNARQFIYGFSTM